MSVENIYILENVSVSHTFILIPTIVNTFIVLMQY